MFRKAMDSSVIVSALLLFVTIDCISIPNHKEMCDILKPNEIFDGINVYKTNNNEFKMYAKGKEWLFLVTNIRIVLLPDTLSSGPSREPDRKLSNNSMY